MFALLTVLGASLVVFSFLSGCRPRQQSLSATVRNKVSEDRNKLFDFAVGLTILSALLA